MMFTYLATILLLPIIPTACMALLLRRQSRQAEMKSGHASGKILGLRVDFAGPVATYVVVLLIAVAATPQPRDKVRVALTLVPTGDEAQVAAFGRACKNLVAMLTASTGNPVRFHGFKQTNHGQQWVSDEIGVERDSINREYMLAFVPEGIAVPKDERVKLYEDDTTISVILPVATQVAALNGVASITTEVYEADMSHVRVRSLLVLENRGSSPQASVAVNGLAGYGEVRTLEIDAYRLTADELSTQRARWARSGNVARSPSEVVVMVNDAFERLRQQGTAELAHQFLVNRVFADEVERPREMRGYIKVNDTVPTIGPIPGGISQGEGVAILMTLEGEYRSGEIVEHLQGSSTRIFEYPFERCILVTASNGPLVPDGKTLQCIFKQMGVGEVKELGAPQRSTERKGICLDLEGVAAADTVRLAWTWRTSN